MLDKLRHLQIEHIDLDEAIGLVAFSKHLAAQYAEFALPVPEWLDDNTKTLKKEITERRRDYLEAQLKEAKARRTALRTAEEKRLDADAEIERLQKALGQQ